MNPHGFTMRRNLHHPKLMIPGPVEVDESVLSALADQVVPHYGTEWTELYKETTDALKRVFQTKGDVFLLVSSGTGGLDAAINSLFTPGETVIVVENGFFGERIAQLAQSHGLKILKALSEWGTPIDLQSVKSLLAKNKDVSGLIAVHHETSTGVLNPIQNLANLAHEFGIPFIVDAVSSLGGEYISMDEWGIDICVSASNKCLEAPPGLAPIAVSENAWKIMESKDKVAPGWYLNLMVWRKYAEEWANWHPFPVTMATTSVVALNAALEELEKEGLINRIARYKDTAHYFREGIQKLGFQLFVKGDNSSNGISAICRLPSMDVSHLVSYLLEERNIRIAGGLGQTSGSIFRVGHMGKAGSISYANYLLVAIDEYIH